MIRESPIFLEAIPFDTKISLSYTHFHSMELHVFRAWGSGGPSHPLLAVDAAVLGFRNKCFDVVACIQNGLP
jgi:hypothetical protein